MYTPPKYWDDVPNAVRTALERPFYKQADGLPGLTTAADVLGWRAGDVNAHWGGPRPVTNLIVGSALGSLGGYGIGRLAEEFLPQQYFEPGGMRKRMAILGGALGAAPAAYQAYDNIRNTQRAGSVFDQWPAKLSIDSGTWGRSNNELFEAYIPRDQFVAALMADPNTPKPLRAASAGLVEAAGAIGSNNGWVSPWDVARVAVGAGAGLASGVIAGKTLGVLAGLSPTAQRQIQSTGLWAGVVKSVVPTALGLR